MGHKVWRLGLKEGMTQKSFVPSSFTEVELSEDVPTIEEALRTLAGVMVRLRGSNLSSGEMKRLQLLADVVRKHKGVYADHIDRRGLEKKYERLVLEKTARYRHEDWNRVVSTLERYVVVEEARWAFTRL